MRTLKPAREIQSLLKKSSDERGTVGKTNYASSSRGRPRGGSRSSADEKSSDVPAHRFMTLLTTTTPPGGGVVVSDGNGGSKSSAFSIESLLASRGGSREQANHVTPRRLPMATTTVTGFPLVVQQPMGFLVHPKFQERGCDDDGDVSAERVQQQRQQQQQRDCCSSAEDDFSDPDVTRCEDEDSASQMESRRTSRRERADDDDEVSVGGDVRADDDGD
ncbi:hypothetical protein MTO96_036089 [Rhipicephalus appendiculatus]